MTLPEFVAGFSEGSALGNPGVVDENISSAPKLFSDPRECALYTFNVGHVAHRMNRFDTAHISDFFRHALHFFFGAGTDSHIRALTRKHKSNGTPDAAPAACNQRHFVAKFRHK
jgi:hypothetical protein